MGNVEMEPTKPDQNGKNPEQNGKNPAQNGKEVVPVLNGAAMGPDKATKTGPEPVFEEPDDPFESNLPTPPDGGWGWWVVFASFMIHVIGELSSLREWYRNPFHLNSLSPKTRFPFPKSKISPPKSQDDNSLKWTRHYCIEKSWDMRTCIRYIYENIPASRATPS